MFTDCRPGTLSKDEIYRDGLPWRQVNYKDNTDISDVSYHLRLFWTLQPPPPRYGKAYTLQDVNDLLGAFMGTPPAGQIGFGWKRDKDNWRSDWRKAVARSYCNIFADIINFLYEVNCRIGHWHCEPEPSPTFLQTHGPGYLTFQISYPALLDSSKSVLVKIFPCNVVIVPMFVDTRLRVIVELTQPGDGEKQIQEWDDSLHNTKALFLRKGIEIAICLKLDSNERSKVDPVSRKGIAATFAFATLCRRRHKGWSACCENEFDIDQQEEIECTCCKPRVAAAPKYSITNELHVGDEVYSSGQIFGSS